MKKNSNIGGNTMSKSNSQPRSRVAELVLGIIGGIFGMIAGIFAMAVGGLGGLGSIIGLGMGCIAVSAIAIIFSALINRNHKLMGWLIIACGVLNIIFVSYFGILSGFLIIIAGGLSLRK